MTDSATLPNDPLPNTASIPNQPTHPVVSDDAQVEALVQQTVQLQQDFQNHDQHVASATAPDPDAQLPEPADTPAVDATVTSQPDPTTQSELDPAVSTPASTEVASTEELLLDDTQNASASAPDPENGKSPLDILEEILGGSGGGGNGEGGEKTQSSEELAAELQAAREKVAQEEALIIEQHRQKMLAELQSPEQQQRDEVRSEQADQMKVSSPFDIHQLERKKMIIDDKSK